MKNVLDHILLRHRLMATYKTTLIGCRAIHSRAPSGDCVESQPAFCFGQLLQRNVSFAREDDQGAAENGERTREYGYIATVIEEPPLMGFPCLRGSLDWFIRRRSRN